MQGKPIAIEHGVSCPRCGGLIDTHVTRDIFGVEHEYVELCLTCQWGRRQRIKNGTKRRLKRR